jgi:hypothetical protein
MSRTKTVTLESLPGNHISQACKAAIAKATEIKGVCKFEFNGVAIRATSKDTPEGLEAHFRAELNRKHDEYMASPQRKIDEDNQRLKEEADARERARIIESIKTMTEAELRECAVPWLRSKQEFDSLIEALANRQHDYGTCVYAMSIAAMAAYNFMGHELGTTGFQAGCANLDFLRRIRNIKGPFAIFDAHDMLYPQYEIRDKFEKNMNEWLPWAKAEAAKLLAANNQVHPDVKAHWEYLAKGGKI